MKDREILELIKLLETFELNCGYDCSNCEWGAMRSENESYTCSLSIFMDLVQTKYNNFYEWEKLHG